MARVITVAQQKGGAGKTTLVANLLALLAQSCRAAAVDIDPQRSLSRWSVVRQSRPVAAAPVLVQEVAGWRIAAELDRLRRDHDVVLIDSPPQIDTDAKLAVRGADLVLIPLQPSAPDLWAADGTLKLARDEGRTVRLLFNRAPAASRLRDTITAELAARKLVLLDQALGNRIAFAQAFAEGLGVTEAAPRSTAAAELRALLSEIEAVVR
jgi:chromosome partitioning protein